MAAIFRTTFSNTFSWMKMYEFRLRFHLSLFLRIQLTILLHWFRWWLGAVQATSHYLNQWWLVYWRIYASLGLSELSCPLYGPGVVRLHWNVAQSTYKNLLVLGFSSCPVIDWCLGDIGAITCLIFKLFLVIDVVSISCEIAIRWMPQDPLMRSQTLYM